MCSNWYIRSRSQEYDEQSPAVSSTDSEESDNCSPNTLDRRNSTMGYGDRLERDREIAMLLQNAEVRYFKAFQSIRDKFRTNYSCSKDYCPMIKERMEHHMKTVHPEVCCDVGGPCPNFSKSSHQFNVKESKCISSCRIEESTHQLKVLHTDHQDHEESANTDIRNNVRDDIVALFQDFPDTQNTTESRQLKNTLINSLVDKISRLVEDEVMDENQIKTEIDNVINKVLGRYPNKTCQMVSFVNGLKSKFHSIVKAKLEKKRGNKDLNGSNSEQVAKTNSETLKDELHDILKDYPVHTNTLNNENYKDKVVGDLVNDIYKILNDKTIPSVVKKTEIDKILEQVNTKYPTATKEEKAELKKVRSKLLEKIKGKRSVSRTKKNSRSVNSSTSSRQFSDINNISKRLDNDILNNYVTKDIKKLYNDFPALAQGKDNISKGNPMRKLIEDVKRVVVRNKHYNENEIRADVDGLINKLSMQSPPLRNDVKLKNDVKDRLLKMIKDRYDNKDVRPTFNNYAKGNFTDSNVGTTGNYGASKSGKNGKYEQYPRAGISSSSKVLQSDNNIKDPKSELRQILESSVYPQIRDERKNSLINRLFYDVDGIKRSMRNKNDAEVKDELNKVIEKLPLWYPGAKRDQVKYVNNLRDKLFDYINDPTQGVSKRTYDKQKSISSYRRLSPIDDSVLTIFTDDNLAENVVRDWMGNISHEDYMKGVDTEDLIKSITDRIAPILQKNSCGKKVILKGAILETLSYIPTTFKCNLRLQKQVNELANNLNYMFRNNPNECCQTESRTMFFKVYRDFFKKPNDYFDDTDMKNATIRDEIADSILYHSDEVSFSDEVELENDITKTLTKKTIASECDISLTAENITEYLRDTEVNTDTITPTTKSIAIFTSCMDNACKPEQKLNDEEIDYINKVSGLVRAWMDTLPVQFNAPEERCFKESMISELAGQIMDINKIDQLVPFPPCVRDSNIKYHTYIWILKFNCFNLKELVPSADNFIAKLKEIPVPDLTKSHKGTRQMMDNIKHMEGEKGWKEEYVPKGIDIVEDEISIWVHEQPAGLFKFDNNTRNDKIHELATEIQPKIARKENENIIAKDVGQWLKKNLKGCTNVNKLQNDLKDRVIKLPQDATLRGNLEEKLDEQRLVKEQIERLKNKPPTAPVDDDTTDIDRTMKDIISKFIEHKYDIDDPTARAAFNHLLKKELQRINLQSGQAAQYRTDELHSLPPDKLFCELEYIKVISDWLKNIPVEDHFKRPHSHERIDFILGLARSISEVEDERARRPCGMDYDMYTGSLIETHLRVLPIPKEYANKDNVNILVSQLISKLEKVRDGIRKKMDESFVDNSGINDENLGDFIEEFIKIHGTDIADNEVKMEAWSVRLIREIRKIVLEKGPDVSKGQVYRQIVSVPKPGDETIQRFETELIYIEDITEWMKNLPFKPLNQEEENNRKRMVCDLAEYLAAKGVITIEDAELTEYLTQWISELPLNRSHEIIIPILIEQLVNRINKEEKEKNPRAPAKQDCSNCCSQASKSKLTGKNPGAMVADAVEKWSKSLPVDACCNNMALKSDAAKKMCQKIGEFNSDPGIYNDDLLYETFLKDGIETIVEKLPNGDDIKVKNEKNNTKLLKTLVEANAVTKEISAGENYKQKLEHTIDASIPDPVTNTQTYDPMFEMYKNKLADMFILENFDHGNDQVKVKYEKQIREKIDKYFEGAQHKNGKPLTKDDIYNELYSILFKVPIPNEKSTMDEVEKVKTRQVIDEWFESLPLKEADDIIELLEWDKRLDSLTKKIHDIENTTKSEDIKLKEVTTWLKNMPIIPSQVDRINEYAAKLIEKLKSTEKERKCVSKKDAKGKKDKSGKSKSKRSKNNICDSTCCKPEATNLEGEGIAPKRKAADVIVDIVEQWCSKVDLSVPSGTEQDKNIRNELVRKITIAISELNMNTIVFNDDSLYKQTLDKELDKILAEVPTCCTFNKVERKMELIESVNAVKPLVNEEKDKVKYKENLDKTVNKELGIDPENLGCIEDEFNALKEEIVDNYVQLNYGQDDEAKQGYKQKIQDAVDKFLTDIKNDKNSDSLIQRNKLICELNKVPKPNENVIKDEVDEIRMKEEVTEFFEENSLNGKKDKPVDQIKMVLAKKLTAIEATGHSEENDKKMFKEVDRSVKNLSEDLDPNKIDGFVEKLKSNEHTRKRRFGLSISPSSREFKQLSKMVESMTKSDVENKQSQKSSPVLPGCAKKNQECCPCDSKVAKPVCPKPYTKLTCDPANDSFCYKMPEYCP